MQTPGSPDRTSPAASSPGESSPALPLERTRALDAFGAAQVEEPPLFSELADVALEAANRVASMLSDAFGEEREKVSTKSSATDMVSEVDVRAEHLVSSLLASRRPGDAIIGEEGTNQTGDTDVRWIVDPLDGTTNFLFGVPAYAVSIAAEVAGEVVVGVVIDPSRNETWAAVRGRGARCNARPCRVAAGRSETSTALVGTGFSYSAQAREWQASVVARMLGKLRDIRRFGSAAIDLCWVGAGRLDAFFEWGLNRWDYAAGQLICAEAGGRVGQLRGGTVLAATPSLYEPLAQLLASCQGLDPPSALSDYGS